VILDLSAVTDTLKNLVSAAWPTAPLWTPVTPEFAVDVTGLSPEAARLVPGAQLSLYLYHIDENNTQENLFWTAQSQALSGAPIQYQPLALDLYYLLSAFADGSYVQEQQAMSIAMRVFHENPVVRGVGPDGQPWELTLTLERRSYDELSRLWQATTSALRLSAVYRAAVVFIEPEPGPAPGPPVSLVDLAVAPGVAAPVPQLLSTQREVSYTTPSGALVTFMQDPATVAAGGKVQLVGTGLDTVAQERLILAGPYPVTAETDVTQWLAVRPQPAPATLRTVNLPAATGTPPAGAPAPGRYTVRLEGTTAVGDRKVTAVGGRAFSTANVPLNIAAGVSAATGPLLTGAARYTVTGTGFAATDLEVLLGTVPLQPSGAAAATAGRFSVGGNGTALTIVPPAGLKAGTYQIRVRAAGIESDPALWLQVVAA
jgi:hypothetical protein